jgi:hypothetical protein
VARRAVLALALLAATSCDRSEVAQLDPAHRRALADTVATLFDSLSAIHRDHPDTGLLRRLHPASDTILFIEGTNTEMFVGDSLFRRVLALHGPVRAMAQRFSERRVHLLDGHHAVLTASENVDWVDTAGSHRYAGLLTIAISRRGKGWVIRAYRGS